MPVRITNPSRLQAVAASLYRRTWFTGVVDGGSRRVAQTYTKPFAANAGSTAMPIRPASPDSLTFSTVSVVTLAAPGAPLWKICTVPRRSVTSIRPSGANAMSHGVTRFACTTSSFSRGTKVGAAVGGAEERAGVFAAALGAPVAGIPVGRPAAGGDEHAARRRTAASRRPTPSSIPVVRPVEAGGVA